MFLYRYLRYVYLLTYGEWEEKYSFDITICLRLSQFVLGDGLGCQVFKYIKVIMCSRWCEWLCLLFEIKNKIQLAYMDLQ